MTGDQEPAKSSTDWTTVKPEEIPQRLIDMHPRVRELTRERSMLEQDLRVVHRAYSRAADLASAVHTVVKTLEDTDLVVNGTMTPLGRSVITGGKRTQD